MKIFNKFIWSKKEPSNKNDVWFDGSTWRMYTEEAWQSFTLPVDAADTLTKMLENASEVFQEKLNAGYGIVIEGNTISVDDSNVWEAIEILQQNKVEQIQLNDYVPLDRYVSTSQVLMDNISELASTKLNKTDIATINGQSLIEGGNITIPTGGESYDDTEIKQQITELSAEMGELSEKIDNISPTPMISVTYAELAELRDNGELVAGMQYRITDYVTTTAQKNTRSAGHQFDVIVTADSNNTLNEVARACLHEGDTYFSEAGAKLEAWQIWYSLDNDTERFGWADAENGKGVIYRMIDEWNNDCPYDFKNIQFKRFAVTKYDKVPSLVVDNKDNYYGYYYGALDLFGYQAIEEATYGEDFVWVYTFALKDFATEIWHDYTILNSIGLGSEESGIITCHSNVIKEHRDEYLGEHGRKAIWLNNIVFFNCYDDISSPDYSECYSYCYSNSFGNSCSANSFGNDCYDNSFDYNCYSNSFGNGCFMNSFGKNCYSNSFDNHCDYNSFDNNCYSNSFGSMCKSNSFGIGCYDIKLSKNTRYKTASVNSNDKVEVYNIVDLLI